MGSTTSNRQLISFSGKRSTLKEEQMNLNMGKADRLIRTIIAVVLIGLLIGGQVTGSLAVIAGVVVAIFLVTSLIGFCPLYRLLGLSTRDRH